MEQGQGKEQEQEQELEQLLTLIWHESLAATPPPEPTAYTTAFPVVKPGYGMSDSW